MKRRYGKPELRLEFTKQTIEMIAEKLLKFDLPIRLIESKIDLGLSPSLSKLNGNKKKRKICKKGRKKRIITCYVNKRSLRISR